MKITNECNMELMARYEDNHFDLAIVDPPYGIGEKGQRNKTGDRPNEKWKNPKSQKYKSFDDSKPPTKEYFQKIIEENEINLKKNGEKMKKEEVEEKENLIKDLREIWENMDFLEVNDLEELKNKEKISGKISFYINT